MALTARVEAWRRGGGEEVVGGHRLFVVRRAGAGPLTVLLHGFPSSSYDWRRLLEVRPGLDVLAPDFLGFGLSDKPAGFPYTLGRQADAVEALVARLGDGGPAVVVAHDMGTSVATELMARDLRGGLSFALRSVLLFNGSILLHLASPTVGQRILRTRLGPVFARLSTERSFRAQFSRIFSPAHPLDAEEAADQWALLGHADGHRRLPETIAYMGERERLTDRWHGAVRDWSGPLSLAWGLRDPVATTRVLDGLRQLRPGVPVHELADAGHYPQIEVPEALAAAVDAAVERARA